VSPGEFSAITVVSNEDAPLAVNNPPSLVRADSHSRFVIIRRHLTQIKPLLRG